MSKHLVPVECNDCNEPIQLISHEGYSSTDYSLQCECQITRIDVSECVNGNNLLDPLNGKWSTLNE